MKSYQCVKCEERHTLPAPAVYVQNPGESWGDIPPEYRANVAARNLYKTHRKYAEGSSAGEAIKRLRDWLTPGASTLLITIPHVARSGMSRNMRIHAHDASGGLLTLTYNVALALGYPMADRDALRIGGCGMDMTFALTDELCDALWPKGYKCPGKRAGCRVPNPWNADRAKRLPHERRHKADGNYTLRREVL